MKKLIIMAALLLGMAHTAFAEQQGVFMQFHRRINPENTRDVNRAPMRLPKEYLLVSQISIDTSEPICIYGYPELR